MLEEILIEFISTFILVFNGSISLILYNKIGALGVSIVHGISLYIALSIGGSANPAITLSKYLTDNIKLSILAAKIITQMLSSLISSLFILIFFSLDHVQQGLPTIGPSVGLIAACIYEIVLSFILVFVSLKAEPTTKLFACSFVLTIANANGADISNGALNPTRAFGIAVVTQNIRHIWVYLICPIVGSMLASFLCIILKKLQDNKHL